MATSDAYRFHRTDVGNSIRIPDSVVQDLIAQTLRLGVCATLLVRQADVHRSYGSAGSISLHGDRLTIEENDFLAVVQARVPDQERPIRTVHLVTLPVPYLDPVLSALASSLHRTHIHSLPHRRSRSDLSFHNTAESQRTVCARGASLADKLRGLVAAPRVASASWDMARDSLEEAVVVGGAFLLFRARTRLGMAGRLPRVQRRVIQSGGS